MPYVEYTRGTDAEEMRREDSGGLFVYLFIIVDLLG
jgi:hypothetical protein